MSSLHLVTGGAGYFGSVLVQHLVDAGHRVRIFDLNPLEDAPDGVEQQQGDIRNASAVRKAMQGVEVVHHQVAQVPLARNNAAFISVNRDGTQRMLEEALAANVRKVVHMSSSAVYGAPDENPVTEKTPPAAGETYGAAKLEAEQLCRSFREKGLDVSIVRPRTILGHGRLGIFQILFEWIFQGQNVPVLGGGHNTYQFVHADDLAKACGLAAEEQSPQEYNIGAERFGTMRDSLEGLCAHANTGSKVVSLPRRPAEWGMKASSQLGLSPLGPYHALMYGRSMWFDTAHAQARLGWNAEYDNVALLVDSYEWYLRNRGDVLAGKGSSPHRRGVRQGVLALVGRALSLSS